MKAITREHLANMDENLMDFRQLAKVLQCIGERSVDIRQLAKVSQCIGERSVDIRQWRKSDLRNSYWRRSGYSLVSNPDIESHSILD
ncbi:unnamed protein product [Adineta ricciae]|uniref:Uncharacterized protein n=1 Tax=Adineta ricciae TaxID=249248 RepID=A0A816HQB5_ADIRI|nr:unnamed protein product [Adineta ricciae]